MSINPLSNRSSGDRTGRPDLLGLDADQIEAARLSEILAVAELGGQPELDPSEDPALDSLVRTTSVLRGSLQAASAHQSFNNFHERSRARIIAATPRPRREAPRAEQRESLLQRWNGLFTSVASAAAAAAATFVVTVLAMGGSSGTPVATVQDVQPEPDAAVAAVADDVEDTAPTRVNLTALSIADQISLYVGLINQVDSLTGDGQPVDQQLLRDLAETGATVKRTIEENPDVTGAEAFVAMETVFQGSRALRNPSITVTDEADQSALFTAQEIADNTVVTAAQYAGASDPGLVPSASDVDYVRARVGGASDTADGSDDDLLPVEGEAPTP